MRSHPVILACVILAVVLIAGCSSISKIPNSSASLTTPATTLPTTVPTLTPGGTCHDGFTWCNGHCVELSLDIGNCGACGNSCPSGQSCVNGTCGCKAGKTLCNGVCSDLNTNTDNCGSCGVACTAGQYCQYGECLCSSGTTNCNGTCTSTQSDPNNCGSCGNQCPVGQVCTSGQCANPTVAVTTVSTTLAGSSVLVTSVSTTPQTYSIPTVSGISPSSGPATGGTIVTITGSGFTGVPEVDFGGVKATSYTVNSDTQITATAPPETGFCRSCNSFHTPLGHIRDFSDRYVYLYRSHNNHSPDRYRRFTKPEPDAPAPWSSGVKITGTGFTGATNVYFSGIPPYQFSVESATEIIACIPMHAAGSTVDVTVVTPGGTSAISPADQLTYIAAPVITGISPSSGPGTGGTVITIIGSGFTGADYVDIGSVGATSFTVVSDTKAIATTEAHTAGTVDVMVAVNQIFSATSPADQFTYK